MGLKKTIGFIFECEFKVIYILSAFYLLGIICGSFYSIKIGGDSQVLVSSILADSFLTLLLKNLLIIVLLFLLGYTVIGAPLICFLLMYSGVGCGLFCGIFVLRHGFVGCVLAALGFFLFYFINFISQVLVSFSSLRLSFALYNVFKNNTRYVSPDVYSRPHIFKFTIFCALTTISCLYYFYIAKTITLLII